MVYIDVFLHWIQKGINELFLYVGKTLLNTEEKEIFLAKGTTNSNNNNNNNNKEFTL